MTPGSTRRGPEHLIHLCSIPTEELVRGIVSDGERRGEKNRYGNHKTALSLAGL